MERITGDANEATLLLLWKDTYQISVNAATSRGYNFQLIAQSIVIESVTKG